MNCERGRNNRGQYFEFFFNTEFQCLNVREYLDTVLGKLYMKSNSDMFLHKFTD